MSTRFTVAATSEFAFTRWGRGRQRLGFDFGTPQRMQAVRTAAAAGATFEDESSGTWTGKEILDLLATGVPTFGEFGGTFELGGGQLADWLGL